MYNTKQEILKFPYSISGIDGNYLLYFGSNTHSDCVDYIANYFNAPREYNGSINWTKFLQKIGYKKSLAQNSGIVISPVFETKREAMNFAISLKTNLLVNIV